MTTEPTAYTLYVTAKRLLVEAADLAFTIGDVAEVKVLPDESDTDVSLRVELGEYVVNANGQAKLLANPQLDVSKRDPRPPKLVPVAPNKPAAPAPTPAPWLELAADLALDLPPTEAHARPMLAARLERFVKSGDPRGEWVRSRFARSVLAVEVTPTSRRLRYAVADDLPLTAKDGGVFGAAPWTVPTEPIPPKFWSTNEPKPRWLKYAAKHLGLTWPGPFADPSRADFEMTMRRYTAAKTSRITRDDRQGNDRLEKQFESRIDELHERSAKGFLTWSDAVDLVRREIGAAVDWTIAHAPPSTPSLGRFALDELSRHFRGMPTIEGFSEAMALDLVLVLVGLQRSEESPALPAKDIRLSVRTLRGIKRRRRAGFDFTPNPRVVEVDEGQAQLIEADDALDSHRVTDAVDPKAIAEMDAKLVGVRAENERLARELATDDAAAKAEKEQLETELAAAKAKLESRRLVPRSR